MVEAAHFRRDHAVHHAVHHLDDGHIESVLAEGRGALESDVTGADDRDTHAGTDPRADGLDVRHRAQHVHARKVGAGNRYRPCVPADREYELVIGESAAIGEAKLPCPGVDRDERIAEHQFAVNALVETCRADREAIRLEFAGEEFLR